MRRIIAHQLHQTTSTSNHSWKLCRTSKKSGQGGLCHFKALRPLDRATRVIDGLHQHMVGRLLWRGWCPNHRRLRGVRLTHLNDITWNSCIRKTLIRIVWHQIAANQVYHSWDEPVAGHRDTPVSKICVDECSVVGGNKEKNAVVQLDSLLEARGQRHAPL